MIGCARLWWGFFKHTFEQGSSTSRMALGSRMNQRHSSSFLFISFRGEFFVLAWANCWLWQLLFQKGHWLVSKQGGGKNCLFPYVTNQKVCRWEVSPYFCVFRQLCEKDTSVPCMQTNGPSWHRVCNASALAFNLQPELIVLIHRQ